VDPIVCSSTTKANMITKISQAVVAVTEQDVYDALLTKHGAYRITGLCPQGTVSVILWRPIPSDILTAAYARLMAGWR
jgi:hypothetical protein